MEHVIMTQELADKLIAVYTEALEHVTKMYIDERGSWKLRRQVLDYLIERHLNIGICNAAIYLFRANIYDCVWLNRRPFADGRYIATPPEACDSVPDMISALQIRIDTLKQFPN